jgi:hypothetical protein
MRSPRAGRRTSSGWHAAVAASLPLLALAAIACTRPPESRVEMCLANEPTQPGAEPSCVYGLEGRRFTAELGGAVGASLTGYRSYPGAARLQVEFDESGAVDRVCFTAVRGAQIAKRLPEAADHVRTLPPAPACFAGRRLDFAWQSPPVTSAAIVEATRVCQERVDPVRSRIHWCHERQHCKLDEVRALWDRADAALRSCVLEQIPLEIRSADSREPRPFVPLDGAPPDPELAVRASEQCEGLPDAPSVASCMHLLGWRPLD